MSAYFKRNINGILGTILFHLFVIIVAMAFEVKTLKIKEESYMIVEPEFIKEFEEQMIDKNNSETDISDIEIEKYFNEIKNVGSNNSKYPDVKTMSQEEMRKMYEEEMLKEKYGDDYEKVMNSTYEDFLKTNAVDSKNDNQDNNSNNDNETNNSYAGPALVFVELDNPERGKSYIDVPVFTCRDGGKVVVNITIGSDGKVKSATVASASSTGDPTCISNAAKDAALKSRFTPSTGGSTEYGKITYSFIQQ